MERMPPALDLDAQTSSDNNKTLIRNREIRKLAKIGVCKENTDFVLVINPMYIATSFNHLTPIGRMHVTLIEDCIEKLNILLRKWFNGTLISSRSITEFDIESKNIRDRKPWLTLWGIDELNTLPLEIFNQLIIDINKTSSFMESVNNIVTEYAPLIDEDQDIKVAGYYNYGRLVHIYRDALLYQGRATYFATIGNVLVPTTNKMFSIEEVKLFIEDYQLKPRKRRSDAKQPI